MFLICYGTRPEIIKLFPLINKFKEKNISFLTLFSGQHQDLYLNYKELIPKPDYILKNIMEHNQTLNKLSSKILNSIDEILINNKNIKYIIVQGDTTTAFSIALAGFHHKIKIIHLEAGLRTYNKFSPYPEELNRSLISKISDIHLCPTKKSINNLNIENIYDNVYLVGNTIVDSFDYIYLNFKIPDKINKIINKIKDNYFLVTLHRRENRGDKMDQMWNQLNLLSENYNIIYITHPSIQRSNEHLTDNIIKLEPQDYISMVFLIKNSSGIITDSGGLQEEAVCARKKVLICRDTTERPETIESGWGKLVNIKIIDNIKFLKEKDGELVNPYGENICEKIIKLFVKKI